MVSEKIFRRWTGPLSDILTIYDMEGNDVDSGGILINITMG